MTPSSTLRQPQLDTPKPIEQYTNKQTRRSSKAKKQKHKKDKKARKAHQTSPAPETDVPEQVLRPALEVETSESTISELDLNVNEQTITFLTTWGSPSSFSFKKSDICQHVPILKSTLNSSFLEGQPQTYKLKHCGPGTVSLFRDWVLSQKFDLESWMGERVNRVKLRYDLAFLFCLAEELQIGRLKKDTLEAILSLRDEEGGDGFIPWCALRVIWSITRKESPLKKVYVDGLVWGKVGKWEDFGSEVFTEEMLREVCGEFGRALKGEGRGEKTRVEEYLGVGKGKEKEGVV